MNALRHAQFLLLLATLTSLLGARAGEPDLHTATVEYREIPREFRLDGVVEAIYQTTMSAQTQGQVQEILFDIDDFVEKGSVIILLKDTEQKARLNKAKAELRETSARLQQMQDEFRRTRDLYEKKLTSPAKMDEAKAGLKTAQARFDAAKAGLAQAEEQYEYTRVRSPYSGIVTHRHVEVGESANPGQKLMTGVSLDQLRVNVDVPQSLIPSVRKIGKARVQIPDNGYIEATKLTIFPFAHHGSNRV